MSVWPRNQIVNVRVASGPAHAPAHGCETNQVLSVVCLGSRYGRLEKPHCGYVQQQMHKFEGTRRRLGRTSDAFEPSRTMVTIYRTCAIVSTEVAKLRTCSAWLARQQKKAWQRHACKGRARQVCRGGARQGGGWKVMRARAFACRARADHNRMHHTYIVQVL